MARNKLAGTSTGKSKSARYYANNPDARAKKNEYNTKYHATKERVAYRSGLNAARRKLKPSAGQDVSHTKGGRYTVEARSKNRARQGAGGRAKRKA